MHVKITQTNKALAYLEFATFNLKKYFQIKVTNVTFLSSKSNLLKLSLYCVILKNH